MTPFRAIVPRVLRVLLALSFAIALASGCGGGSTDGPGVGGGGTGAPQSFSQGPITGFGSIIVNGVHFDDSGASVTDDDGNALSNTQSLRLGTEVEVHGGAIANGVAPASTIVVHVDLLGPVTAAWNASTGRLSVLGQPVQVLPSTALDGLPGGAAALAAGKVVAVSSLYDKASGVYVATRIDPVAGATRFSIRGAPSAVDAAAGTFTIGTQAFAFDSTTPPAGLAAGQLVRVVLSTLADSHGRWVASTVGQAAAVLPDGRLGIVDGVVSSTTDATHFTVAGVQVDASGAHVIPTGAAIKVSSRVQVVGIVMGGTLVASAVHVTAVDDDQDDDDDQPGGHGNDGKFEVDGAILSLDAAHQVFTMRGPTTVDYSAASYAGGKVTDLKVGSRVEVTGDLSPDGTRLMAKKIKFGR